MAAAQKITATMSRRRRNGESVATWRRRRNGVAISVAAAWPSAARRNGKAWLAAAWRLSGES
jgi:hypothetical protein